MSDSDTPPVEFTALPLDPALVEAVTQLGFTSATPIQAAAIPVMIEGRDLIGRARTGSGKTAAFGLPL
ncbi:MAG: DEAD/DEAH box helicase, partial [Myxococcota bacterium]